MKQFSQLLQYQFRENSHRPAIIYRQRVLTFGELAERAAVIGVFLREQGLTDGEIVILYTPDKLPFLLVHLGIILCGGISLPLNPGFTPEEMVYFINDSSARFVFASGEQAARIRKIADGCPNLTAILDPGLPVKYKEPIKSLESQIRELLPGVSNKTLLRGVRGGGFPEKSPPAGPCFMLYSSGTTGQPKGVVHTQANTAASLVSLQKGWKFSPGDVLLNVLPLYHIHGLSFATHLSLVSGSTMILEDRFHPLKTLERIKEATVFMGIPTFYYSFLRRPEFKAMAKEWRRTRLFTCGSAPIRPDVLQTLEAIIGKPLINRYGMTESHVIASLPLDGPYKHGSVGLPLPGVRIKISQGCDDDVEQEDNSVGEVRVKSRNLFHHYWQRLKATDAAFDSEGFFKTGDLGYQDREGFLFLVGRKSDLIISSGYNVYPAVVERVLNQGPGVKESAVIGVPDPLKGEKVMAVIVAEAPGSLNLAELKKHCREKLVSYQCPALYKILAELPRNTMGKVIKRELKQKFIPSV